MVMPGLSNFLPLVFHCLSLAQSCLLLVLSFINLCHLNLIFVIYRQILVFITCMSFFWPGKQKCPDAVCEWPRQQLHSFKVCRLLLAQVAAAQL